MSQKHIANYKKLQIEQLTGIMVINALDNGRIASPDVIFPSNAWRIYHLPFTIYHLQFNFNINTYIDYFYQNKTKF